MTDFTGKTVFITGGARGQGRSHALAFADRGANIVILDSVEGASDSIAYDLPTQDDLDATQRDIEAKGVRCLALTGDVRHSEHIESAVKQAVSEFGSLDVTIANAGIFALRPAVETDDALWDDVIAINLSGVFRTVRAAAAQVKDSGVAGRIITIASMAGRMEFPNAVAYVAAKWGVIGLTKTFAAELGQTGTTVNVVCPTNVDTTMVTDNPDAATLFTGKDDPSEEEVEKGAAQFTKQGIPWVEPEDVTAAVLFLASPEARYITGEALTVSGGQIADNVA
ncbi:mycofactocin-coupled SDR family oxidoreductase [Herbiconiux sp. VKM Ac-2851]|uniref:mycofactocin-coupled SDR family oxidoreductase n=1 Tax=Herbiconiux sp. VKM Ac-2851 TaxID=2739025 RepID=UPI0015672C1A|nr:mycofactocin-coupled SDR family oxidoreductase [Herbiconiux sp. VKM Ac-2851]NQX37186.1 mycofactocin-coupled SDR family oxidoreductase [Herbiconiux sp. VKM Ac-2851]